MKYTDEYRIVQIMPPSGEPMKVELVVRQPDGTGGTEYRSLEGWALAEHADRDGKTYSTIDPVFYDDGHLVTAETALCVEMGVVSVDADKRPSADTPFGFLD